MDSQSYIYLFSLIALLVLSAVFAASETALLASSKVKLKKMADKGITIAEKILRLRMKRENTLTTILIVNNLVNIGATVIATKIAERLAVNAGINSAIVWVTPIMTVVIVLFGEMIPKTAATRKTYAISRLLYYPVLFSTIVCLPFVWLFHKITSGVLWVVGIKQDPRDETVVSESDLEAMLDVSEREGIIPEDEREMIKRVFEFGDTTVKEAMVARVDMTTLPIDCSLSQLIQTFRESGHSRIPIYEESQDNIKGVVHIKDLIPHLTDNGQNFDIARFIRNTLFVPQTKQISELFSEMRHLHSHLAIAVDEYGGVSGLVTLEDILEELVGEIQDEYDEEPDQFVKLDNSTYILAGDMEVEDMNEFLDTDIPSEEYDTIAGFINDKLGHLGKLGEKVTEDGLSFIVDKIKKFRITKVRVIDGRKKQDGASEDE